MVRGITNFIQQSPHELLRPHKLHDTYLIIDGKNISFQLYHKQAKDQTFYGGDYDNYSACVASFFDALLKCNITPIVIFDGNNESKKLPTNFHRYSNRLRTSALYNPHSSEPQQNSVYPLFIRTVFTDVINKKNILAYRCQFAADNELANLAKDLDCPVLSQDSDYFIYDVLYVTYESLRLCPVRNTVTNGFYLECELFSSKYFLNYYPGLRWEHMTLLATVCGNDYIDSDEFERFHRKLSAQKGRAARMRNLVGYLQRNSFDSVLFEILDSVNVRGKKDMALRIADNIIGYRYKRSSILECLNIKCDKLMESSVCGTIDQLVSSVFKKYFKVDILEQDRLMQTIGLLSDIDLANNKVVPKWFLHKYQTCVYTTPVFEIACSVVYFLPCILEDFDNTSVHSISYNIISALNKILTQSLKGEEVPLKIVGRNDKSFLMNKFDIHVYKLDITPLEKIPNLTTDEKFDVIFSVLNIKSKKQAFINLFKQLPSDWHLLVICISYWRNNAKSKITDAHLSSVFLCAVVLKILDRQIDAKRSIDDITSTYPDLINAKVTNKSDVEFATFQDIIEAFSQRESALALFDLIPLFRYNDGSKFDRTVLHAFGELQSCVYFANSLNSLLEEPIEKILISECYNDTFLINVYEKISKRGNVGDGLREILPHSVAAKAACLFFVKKQVDIFEK